jgi:hypothetical protein
MWAATAVAAFRCCTFERKFTLLVQICGLAYC